MKFFYTSSCGLTRILLFSFLFFASILHAQIGIGNTNPNASSMLDITSTSKGILTPRMTTAQRIAISNPANGLMVYDLNESAFYYYEATAAAWVSLNSSQEKRNNFVLVKSQADFPAPVGGIITLQTNTYYEINGTINLTASIDLNGAYISGLDAWEDVLSYNGTVFVGNQGGSIRNIAIAGGGTAFNITGGTTFTVQNTIVYQMASVGTISNVGLYFSNIMLFYLNTNGITYNNIQSLLLSNQSWFEGNGGTYETFTGTFGQIQKVGGLSTVTAGATGLNVSSNPTLGEGILMSCVFSGAGTYVNKYTVGSYPGFNFNNNWYVSSPGISTEMDSNATGDINFSAAVGSGQVTTFSGTGSGSRRKVQGTTTSNNLFRFEKVGDNRIVYKGAKKRFFKISASVSYQSTAELTLILYIARNGVVIDQTKVYSKGTTGYFVTDQGILALPIVGTVELNNNDYIEIWAERYAGSGNMNTVSLNLTAR